MSNIIIILLITLFNIKLFEMNTDIDSVDKIKNLILDSNYIEYMDINLDKKIDACDLLYVNKSRLKQCHIIYICINDKNICSIIITDINVLINSSCFHWKININNADFNTRYKNGKYTKYIN